MQSAQLVLALLIAVAALVTIARRLGIAYPIFLVIGGLVLGLVPGTPRVEVDPDLIFLFILPPLLYVAAFFTPLRSLRANLGTIGSLAVGLVVVTAFSVAAVVHALIPGLPWAVAIALGAIVAPHDAVAAAAIASRLAVPRRLVSVLEGESLLKMAGLGMILPECVAVAVGDSFRPRRVGPSPAPSGRIRRSVSRGLAIAKVRERSGTPVEVTISLNAPRVPAQGLAASGVIATVVAGLYLGRRGSRIMGPDARLTGRAVWETITFLLHGMVFIITGLEVPFLLRSIEPATAIRLVGIGLVVSLVLFLIRALWIFPSELVAPVVRGDPHPPRFLAHSLVLSWAGMRGVVSLTLALALPLTLPGGAPFPAREALVIVTVTVIVFTLLAQGLSLPWLIRRLGLGTDPELREEEARARQRSSSRRRAGSISSTRCGPVTARCSTGCETYAHRSEHVDRQRDASASEKRTGRSSSTARFSAPSSTGREALMRLRAEAIDDDVMRRWARLDLDGAPHRLLKVTRRGDVQPEPPGAPTGGG
jgi:CPA1 family monovalent cation:H+ antiporter